LQLFELVPDEGLLVEDGITSDPVKLQIEWSDRVIKHLTAANLQVPQIQTPVVADRSIHTEHLAAILADLQEVAQTEIPETEW
jgi:1,2-phenylacetyl-CoA epoxidase catalytic subunit